MPQTWNAQMANNFWKGRVSYVLGRNNQWPQKEDELQSEIEERKEHDRLALEEFKTENQQKFLHPQKTNATSQQLSFWITNSSWTYCPKCCSLKPEKLLPRYAKMPVTKHLKDCLCSGDRYLVPSAPLIPEPLGDLSVADISVLRPFEFHCGDYKRLQHGYRKKTGMSRVSCSFLSVEEKIENISDKTQKQRCQCAYSFLMNSPNSCYSSFIVKRAYYLSHDKHINLYEATEIQGIECALWPNIYPFTNWCETIIKGNDSRLSTKISFYTKVLSSILDYAINYELLQFHYDLWIFKTVSGAIASARRMKCSPARALNAKVFSAGYWKTQHRLLVDAVDQFGYPDIFLTINPYEWSFPFPPWLEHARTLTGRKPTELAAFETTHIAHTLEQIVRGYFCGSNDSGWSTHLFNYKNIRGRKNVNTYFYRFEFQQRGTVHLHLLVWLKNITMMQHSLIRADIPWENADNAYLVSKLQPSDRGCLPLNDCPTTFCKRGEQTILSLYHPAEAFAANLRAYITTIVPALRCRMDFQLSDGRSMLLRYVTSYASKWQDAYSNEALYSTHVNPYQAAYRHVKDIQPCEPEMWLYMSPIKFSWSCSRTKNYFVPTSATVDDDKVHKKYLNRPTGMNDLSFLEWLRNVNHVPSVPKPYTQGHTLVSVKVLSPYTQEYFFQEILMNHAHRSLSELTHPRIADLPDQLRHFASAVHVMPEIWKDQDRMRSRFQRQGNKEFYVETLMAYVASLYDTFFLWQKTVFKTLQLQQRPVERLISFPLDHIQSSIVDHVMGLLHIRDEYYSGSVDSFNEQCDEEFSGEEERRIPPPASAISTDWRKFILITGKGGSGKSQVICATIQKCIEFNLRILVACPTGILARHYHNKFSGNSLVCDTLHSAFNFPFDVTEIPRINWSISEFDIVILDELSMVSQRIAQHVIQTISEVTVRPVVLVTGDEQQIQPIETVQNRITEVPSILDDKNFYALVHHFHLSSQHRVLDVTYDKFLNHIRHWQPTQDLLDKIQEGKVLCEAEISDENLQQVILDYPDATILTFTRQATSRINQIVISNVFDNETPLALIQCDCELEPMPIYKNMRVLITQNRSKENNVVNGQQAVVHTVQNATVFLKLSDDKIISTYPVTYLDKDNHRCTSYPFMPCYAVTIAKAQGQTLEEVILWLDIPKIPHGFAYVALSRVRRSENLKVLKRIKSEQCIPVQRK